MGKAAPLQMPSKRPAWPLQDGWWLVGSERAWRLDEDAPEAEKHYFMIMKPDTPYWQVGLFTPQNAQSAQMWLTRMGYKVPPDFTSLATRSATHGIPIGMLQFAVTQKGGRHMKCYHATDERGQGLNDFKTAWTAAHNLNPMLNPRITWETPIEGLAIRDNKWELYTQAIKTSHHQLPHKTLHNVFDMLGATCRQYSLASDGTQTWYYTNMEEPVNASMYLTLLDLVIPTSLTMTDKVLTALKHGAVMGDLIVQSPAPGIYHPVADMLWPVNGEIVFAP